MLSHVDENKQPTMVNVSNKEETQRYAHARSIVFFPDELVAFLQQDEIQSPKGPVLATAIIAGTMAVKKTGELIPFCHTLPVESCKIEISKLDLNRLNIDCYVTTFAKTGVEMEALTGAAVAALTVYDMCKALSHLISIEETKLIEKKGGKSDFRREC